jgi:6-phosphofructokinase 1
MIYLPEMIFDETDFLKRVSKIYNEQKQCLIVISEGIKDKDGNFIGAMSKVVDAFGHSQLGGVGLFLGDLVEEKLGIKYRSIELSTPQRSAAFIRSETDVNEAIEVGRKAVQFMIEGKSSVMVTIDRAFDKPYQITYETTLLGEVANQEKMIPSYMYDQETLKMNPSFFDYLLPLIEGEFPQLYKNGIQEFFLLK